MGQGRPPSGQQLEIGGSRPERPVKVYSLLVAHQQCNHEASSLKFVSIFLFSKSLNGH